MHNIVQLFGIIFYIITWITYSILPIKIICLLTLGKCKSKKYLGGKTAVVTGGSSGIGYETALNLASRGCRVIIADIEDCLISEERIIQETGNTNISSMFLDLGSFASVREFATDLLENEERLDFLFNNAGCCGFLDNTEDGLNKVIQINYLGHFLLTHLLAPLLIKTKSSRVVFTSSCWAFASSIKQGISINSMPDTGSFTLNDMQIYGNSKLCIIAAINIFAERFKKHDVVIASCHPGFVDSGFLVQLYTNTEHFGTIRLTLYLLYLAAITIFGKTPKEGAEIVLHCALSPKVKSGDYIWDCVSFPKPWVITEEFSEEVWEESIRLANIDKVDEVV